MVGVAAVLAAMSLLHRDPTQAQTTVFLKQYMGEATWGADPLEFEGGFRSLQYDSQATFRSSLAKDGTAHWNIIRTDSFSSATSANASFNVSYSNVDWNFLRTVYGWASVQYSAWARGELIIGGNETQHIILHTDAILEFWIDDAHFFGGDFYSYRNSPPVLHLKPGRHRIDLRLVRDVRAFGGILEPTIDVVIGVERVSGSLDLAKPGILMSDVIDGRLATPHASVTLRNSGAYDIEVTGVHAASISADVKTLSPLSAWSMDNQMLVARDVDSLASEQITESTTKSSQGSGIIIVAGQTRPVAFNITLPSHNASSIAYNITYKIVNSNSHSRLEVNQRLKHVSLYTPHKITFMGRGSIVSYSMLRPPAKNATCHHKQTRLPVLLVLHGAGLEADNSMVTGALDSVSDLCAWTIFPTGVTPWSGDDWHNWGFADVEAAIDTIPAWIHYANWSGPSIDVNRWIVSGHSNGGQGAWYAVTHRPDKVLAAIPISGYSSIQKYVPYELWQPADPRRTAVIAASLNSYRHEMLMANTRGIPIQHQHGEVDDNVPAYHSRFLAQQLHFAGVNSSYSEVPGQNHWWDGVMTTPELVDFYHTEAKSKEKLPRDLYEFSIIVGDPGDMGSKSGIRVTQLEDPGQYGRVHVRGHTLRTSNVLSIEFSPPFWKDVIIIDGQTLEIETAVANFDAPVNVCLSNNTWTMEAVTTQDDSFGRRGRQLGSMAAILRTHGPIIIRHPGTIRTNHLAVQVSRNLHQYFRADTMILINATIDSLSNGTSNVITLVLGDTLKGAASDFPIQLSSSGISLRDSRGRQQLYYEARGAVWLQPLQGERIELVIWGADDEGLRQAARLVPMLTGVGQPDFVILDEEAKWRGVDGALAMGFFDSQWQVTASSFVS